MPEKLSETKLENPTLEEWLETSFTKQYLEQVTVLNKTGFLEILREKDENGLDQIGIKGIDGKEYPLPEEEEIRKIFVSNHGPVLETKLKQGFSRLQITPFALPLEKFFKLLEQNIKKNYQQKTLHGINIKDDTQKVLLPLDLKEPLFVWEDWKNSDNQNNCLYYPALPTDYYDYTPFSGKLLGQTKKEILKNSSSLFPGFEIMLLEKNLTIPKENKGKTIHGRKQLEAGLSPIEYLKKLSRDSQYLHERALTIEDWITLFITHLENNHSVLPDYWGSFAGSICILLSSFQQKNNSFAQGLWDLITGRCSIARQEKEIRSHLHGTRTAIKIY
jgi:hypothetical protein